MRANRLLLLVLLGMPGAAFGQSFNVDFGLAGSAPSPSYGAAGAPGVWNVFGVLPGYERRPLVNTAGLPTSAAIYMFGGNSLSILSVDDPTTSGDDAALIDDMLIGMNDPVDVCLWVEGLAPGTYEVISYGITPGDPGRQCRLRVDNANEPPLMVGGTWPGGHSVGVTYARHTVSTTGVIGFHSGLYNGFLQSGMNGFQIRPTSTVGVGPIAPSDARFSVSAHPNPATGVQRLAFAGAPGAATRVTLVDLAGREVWSGAVPGDASALGIEWSGQDHDGRRVPPGVYLARWERANGSVLASARLLRVR